MTPSSKSFIVFPAIDLLDGKSVRLEKGLRSSAQVMHKSPLDQLMWIHDQGAKWVHIVNLNAAFGDSTREEGHKETLKLIERMCALNLLKIQLGGGIRSESQLKDQFSRGVSRLIVGTWASQEASLVQEMCSQFKDKLVIGLDTMGDPPRVAVRGWTQMSALSPQEFASPFVTAGCVQFLHTDIERDGLLQGANLSFSKRLAQDIKAQVILSGGIRSLDEIHEARLTDGIGGVIIGKAMHAGTLKLADCF